MASDRGDGNRPMVLVLQNEPLLMMVMSEYVEDAGCEAVPANSVPVAIRILEERTDIRVVFADLDVRHSIMGLRLVALIRERWPPIELVLTGTLAPASNAIPARGVFCDKPFREKNVVAAIRALAA